jgi:hypothetical protein
MPRSKVTPFRSMLMTQSAISLGMVKLKQAKPL